ncbi:MAG: alpha/beta hydrolase [Thermodesulfobacteriota bacterium]
MTQEQITFPNHAGEALAATFHRPDTPNGKGVVLGHCFTCSRHTGILREISSRLENRGFYVLRFDFSGNGQSQGLFAESSLSKHIREMRIAVDWLRDKGADQWIGLVGHSMGGAIAVLSMPRIPEVGAVAAIGSRLMGFDPLKFLGPQQIEELKASGKITFSSRNRTLELTTGFFKDAGSHSLPETVRNLDRPLMIVHGEKDELIPVAEAYEARKLNPQRITLEIIPDADHMLSYPDHRAVAAEKIVSWIERQSSR